MIDRERAGATSPRDPAITVLAIGLVCLVAIFWREFRAAVDVWNASTAYSHCYLVLPMTLYLLWERRGVFNRYSAHPEAAWSLIAVPITLVWLVSERLGFMEGRQLAAIAGVELFLLSTFGRELFTRVSGPLLFLFFLVPFGAFLTPALQRFTAGFTIVGLDLFGIPNYSDKFIIETPAGVFFVAEACAGLRFLIAAIAFGVFYALLSYTSPARRLAFIAASIVVPIVANGLRALGIVVLGQILGSAEAAAADHIIYGWVFFSVVMLLLIAVGQLFREDDTARHDGMHTDALAGGRVIGWGALSGVVLLLAGPAAAAVIDMQASVPVLGNAEVFDVPSSCVSLPPGRTNEPATWQISMTCGGINFVVNLEMFSPRSTSSVMVAQRRRVTQEVSAEDAAITSISVPDGAGNWTVVQTTEPNRVTAYASWVNGKPGRSGIAGRIEQARDSLFGSNYEPALMTITAAELPGGSASSRKATLDRLVGLLQAQPQLNERMMTLSAVAGGLRSR